MTVPNAELAYKVLDHIDAHPESWVQDSWWCGTGGCFAGWAVKLSGEDPGWVYVAERAAELLGFTSEYDIEERAVAALGGRGRCDLFSASNTREDLDRIVAAVFGPRPGGAA